MYKKRQILQVPLAKGPLRSKKKKIQNIDLTRNQFTSTNCPFFPNLEHCALKEWSGWTGCGLFPTAFSITHQFEASHCVVF